MDMLEQDELADAGSNSSTAFIYDWLTHFHIHYQKDVPLFDGKFSLDLLLPQFRIGILIPSWKKPISVQVVNRAIIATRELNLREVFIIADKVGDYAADVLDKYSDIITRLHPNGLLKLATTIANLKTRASKLRQANLINS